MPAKAPASDDWWIAKTCMRPEHQEGNVGNHMPLHKSTRQAGACMGYSLHAAQRLCNRTGTQQPLRLATTRLDPTPIEEAPLLGSGSGPGVSTLGYTKGAGQ